MNESEYYRIIADSMAYLIRETKKAMKRNQWKDILIDDSRYGSDWPARYFVKGWEGYDLMRVLKREYQEFIDNPSPEEAGDIAWTLAMILEQHKKEWKLK